MKRAATQMRTRAPSVGGSQGAKGRRVPARGEAILIRPAQAADLSQVIALDEQVTGIAKADYWRNLFDRYHNPHSTQQFFLVATEADGAGELVLGFILGEIRAWEFGSEPCGWVFALSVRPDARLRGLGQALLEKMTVEFKKARVTKMRTMVARDRRLHMLFFRAAGMMAGPYIELEKDLT